MSDLIQEGRSLSETPTYLVASVVTVMVFVGLLVERSIYRVGKVSRKEVPYNFVSGMSENMEKGREFIKCGKMKGRLCCQIKFFPFFFFSNKTLDQHDYLA